MTTINNSKLSNVELSAIQSYVERVSGYLKQSTSAWLSIASEFAHAKQNLSKLGFQRFITDCGFTTAVADKLVSVGRCSVLHDEKNLSVLSSADGWTVLYELSKLAPQKIGSLLELVANSNEKKLTREMIYNVANNNPPDQKRLIVASIEIDDGKLKSLTAAQFSEIQSSISALERQIERINAGFIFKPREKTIVKIADRAQANSNVMIYQTAA